MTKLFGRGIATHYVKKLSSFIAFAVLSREEEADCVAFRKPIKMNIFEGLFEKNSPNSLKNFYVFAKQCFSNDVLIFRFIPNKTILGATCSDSQKFLKDFKETFYKKFP